MPDTALPERTRIIRIAAALLVGANRRVLLVRKRGTTAFMQPGGKIEPGESPVAALIRELHEELGLVVSPGSPQHLGRFSAVAANESDAVVDAELFKLAVVQPVSAAAEIAEAVWFDPFGPLAIELAPLTRDLVLPAYLGMLGEPAGPDDIGGRRDVADNGRRA